MMNRTVVAVVTLCLMLAACTGLPPEPLYGLPAASPNAVTPGNQSPTVAAAAPETAGTPVAATIAPATAEAPRAPVATLAAAGAVPAAPPGAVVLASDLPNPDDVAVGAGGELYFSDVGDGTVKRLDPDGRIRTVGRGLGEPEGIVVLPDGGLIVAEQSHNRLLRLDPATGQTSPILQLRNRTGRSGVDGIALDLHDPSHPSLIVPDSANGTVLRAALDGQQVREIGRGFVRPVAAWVEAGGSVLIADEFGNALVRLGLDGSKETVARLPQPDDVVGDGQGRLYVNTLVDGAVHVISPDGTDRVLIRGLALPQGAAIAAAMAPDGSRGLIVVDSGHGRILRVAPLD